MAAREGIFQQRRMKKHSEVLLADLCRVGRETPAGQWLRRYWLAVGTTRELYDIPRAVKVLGEDLVLFRDLSGRPGLLHAHCAHRGASLEFGKITDRGIQCCYHGWHFAVDGTLVG